MTHSQNDRPDPNGTSLAPGVALYAAPRAEAVPAPPCVEQREVLCTAFRALPSAAAVLDLDGTVLVWNAAAEALLGWSEQEMAGARGLGRVWPGSEGSSLFDTREAVDVWRVRMRHRNGSRLSVRVPGRDSAAVGRLDPRAAMLMTRAARQRLGCAGRLVAPNFMLVPDDPAAVARVMVRRNRKVERTAARAARSA